MRTSEDTLILKPRTYIVSTIEERKRGREEERKRGREEERRDRGGVLLGGLALAAPYYDNITHCTILRQHQGTIPLSW